MLHFTDIAEWLYRRFLARGPLAPGPGLQYIEQPAAGNAHGHRLSGHKRLATEIQGPDRGMQMVVETLEEAPVAFQAHEELGVGKVIPFADHGADAATIGFHNPVRAGLPLVPTFGVNSQHRTGAVLAPCCVVVAHEPALAIHPDSHSQPAEVIERFIA
jgi:hypothetical protein